MLGVIGYIVPEIYRFPGELAPGLKFADIPNGIDAINVIPGAVRKLFSLFDNDQRNRLLTWLLLPILVLDCDLLCHWSR